MQEFISYFFIYSFLGWCCEVAFHTLTCGDFSNRGFLFGPVCPIYGFGVIFVVLATEPFAHNIALLFLVSALLTSALELATGFLLDKIFHTKWWDYSNFPLNIGGYICPVFSLLWGLACVFVIKIVHPLTERVVTITPMPLGIILNVIFSVVFVADLVITVLTILKFNSRLRSLDKISRELHEVSDKLGLKINDNMLEIMEKGETAKERLSEIKAESEEKKAERRFENELKRAELEEKLASLRAKYEKQLDSFRASDRRLLHAFPDMKSRLYNIDFIREKIEKRKK